MSKSTELNAKVKFGLKSFITVVAILLAVLVFVGVLTYVIPAGRYTVYTNDETKKGEPFYEYTDKKSLKNQIVVDDNGEFVYNELTEEENSGRLPFYRWLTSPFEALFLGSNSSNMIMIIALLLVLGGTGSYLFSRYARRDKTK